MGEAYGEYDAADDIAPVVIKISETLKRSFVVPRDPNDPAAFDDTAGLVARSLRVQHVHEDLWIVHAPAPSARFGGPLSGLLGEEGS